MTEFLALTSALFYGAADFLGGLTARRINAVAAVTVSQFVGLVLLAAAIGFLPGVPARADIGWGICAGLSGGIGVALLYQALAIGTMAVVAPTTAVCAVALPVLAAFLLGERLRAITGAGIALAIAGIVLVSQQPASADAAPPDLDTTGKARRAGWRSMPPGIGIAMLSGVAIGLFYLSLARTGAAGGMWPLLFARLTSVLLFMALALATSTSLRMPRPVMGIAIASGALDMLANALYLVATRGGPLSIVVTLSSLYPASTVVLAQVFLGERLSGLQKVGIVCTLTAVLLIVGTAG